MSVLVEANSLSMGKSRGLSWLNVLWHVICVHIIDVDNKFTTITCMLDSALDSHRLDVKSFWTVAQEARRHMIMIIFILIRSTAIERYDE